MRTEGRRTLFDMAAAILRHIAASVAGLAIIPLVAHLLGVEALGAWALLGTIAFTLGLADLGLGAAVQRASARREDNKTREIMSAAHCALVAVGPLLAVLVPSFGLDIGGAPELRREIDMAVVPTMVGGLVNAWGSTYRAFLVGRGALRPLAGAKVGAAALQVALTAVGLSFWPHVWVVGAALLFASLVETTGNILSARALDPLLPVAPRLPASWETTRLALRDGSAALAIAAAGLLAIRLDVAILAHSASLASVAAYAVASRAVDQSFTVAKQVSTALVCRLASAATRDQAVVTGTRALGGLVAVGMVVLCLPGRDLLALWAGEAATRREAVQALAILGLAATVSAAHETVAAALMVSGRTAWDAAVPLVLGYAVNIALSVLFVDHLGVLAVAGGTLLGNVLTTSLLWARALQRFGWTLGHVAAVVRPAVLAGTVALTMGWLFSPTTGVFASLLATAVVTLCGLGAGGWLAFGKRSPIGRSAAAAPAALQTEMDR